MFWFDKGNKDVVFGDIRENETHQLCDGRALEIKPDMKIDFRDMPFEDGSFKLVVFDPPHLVRAGKKSWLALKYGKLNENWQDDIKAGFAECFRVLAKDGILIFKWNETQVRVSELLALTDKKPLFGHKSGKNMKTHWITFMNL
jgi:SAM-dependent methyltransferase